MKNLTTRLSVLLMLGSVLSLTASQDRKPTTVAICNEFGTAWDLMPHRLSRLELTSTPNPAGGSFGDMNTPLVQGHDSSGRIGY